MFPFRIVYRNPGSVGVPSIENGRIHAGFTYADDAHEYARKLNKAAQKRGSRKYEVYFAQYEKDGEWVDFYGD